MFIFKSQYDFDDTIEIGVFLASDHQIGAEDTDYDYIDTELQMAVARNDRLCFNGDLFDAIFPSDKKRFRPSVLHPSLQGRDDVADAAVDMAYRIFAPYAEYIDVIGVGNHDDSNVKYHHSDLVMQLVKRLNTMLENKNSHHRISYGGYCGFIAYLFFSGGKCIDSLRIQYHHGSGGAAPVTKGMIDFNRSDVWIEEADIIWKGHKHNKLYYKDQVVSLSPDGQTYTKRSRLHVLTGAYGKHYEPQDQTSVLESGRKASFVEDRFMSPQGLGGFRIVFRIENGCRMIRLEDEELSQCARL